MQVVIGAPSSSPVKHDYRTCEPLQKGTGRKFDSHLGSQNAVALSFNSAPGVRQTQSDSDHLREQLAEQLSIGGNRVQSCEHGSPDCFIAVTARVRGWHGRSAAAVELTRPPQPHAACGTQCRRTWWPVADSCFKISCTISDLRVSAYGFSSPTSVHVALSSTSRRMHSTHPDKLSELWRTTCDPASNVSDPLMNRMLSSVSVITVNTSPTSMVAVVPGACRRVAWNLLSAIRSIMELKSYTTFRVPTRPT